MKEEIGAAVDFLTCLVGKSTDITAEQVEMFQRSLGSILTEKFEGHWFPEQPCRGQAYRCIRVNSSVPWDSALERAAKMCGLQYEKLNLPLELTVWVDPREVCCRFGESSGSLLTIASFKDNKENLPHNVPLETISDSSVLPQESPDSTRKQKSRRKTVVERPRKQASSRSTSSNPHIFVKNLTPKHPFTSKNIAFRPTSFFDWNPAAMPFAAHANGGYQDLPFMPRRPRKMIRSVYLNHERYHWARK